MIAAAAVLLALLLVGIQPAPTQPSSTAARLQATIGSIAAGNGSAERRLSITRALEAAGIAFDLENFANGRGRNGTNVIARVPGGAGAGAILLGAHYDRVAQGQGVVDNGGSCAMLLELLAALRSAPLARHTLLVAFFDLEEDGLSGSRAYFAASASSGRPAHAINLDVFAYGDSLFATASRPDGVMLTALRKAGSRYGIPIREAPVERYPGSDHQSMIAAGIDTLGLALVDTADVDAVLRLGPRLSVPGGVAPPRILTIIHTPEDTIEQARPGDMEKALPVLEQVIRDVDVAD